MKQFFKYVLASALGAILALGFIILLFVIAIMASIGSGGNKTKIKNHSVLHLKLDAPIIDRALKSEMNFDPFGDEPGIGLDDLTDALEKAAADSRVDGIFLDLSGLMASPSSALDIHNALLEFKESGKWITTFGESLSHGAYYLGSTANEIYIYPEGGLDFFGLSAEMFYLKNMLDKLEIEIQVLRGPDNKYKSAVEPFMYDEMSGPAREQTTAFLGDIWSTMLNGISDCRNIPVDKLNQIADSIAIRLPVHAVNNGLIDGLRYRDEVMAELYEKVKSENESEAEAEDEDESEDDTVNEQIDFESEINFVSLGEYLNGDHDEEEDGDWKSDRVAVVYAVGGIESGEGDDATIGSDRIAAALREARTDEKVKAVVLRVNSPGGSALASDVIWRETQLIKEAGKPFVVSMGDVAASGGYYISCGADAIYANRNTITGSIGVFGMLPNMEGFFENKLGINFDRVTTNANSDIMSVNKGMNPTQHAAIEEAVTHIYERFIGIVADGRGMEVNQVDSIAQGRVWSGEDALEVGLVDELGNLEDAVLKAADLAELENYRIRNYPKIIDPFEQMMKELTGQAEIKLLESQLGIHADIILNLIEAREILESGEIQARLPYFIQIEL